MQERGDDMASALTTDQTMEILRTTVPRLEELTVGVPQKQTDYFEWKFDPALEAFRSLNADPA